VTNSSDRRSSGQVRAGFVKTGRLSFHDIGLMGGRKGMWCFSPDKDTVAVNTDALEALEYNEEVEWFALEAGLIPEVRIVERREFMLLCERATFRQDDFLVIAMLPWWNLVRQNRAAEQRRQQPQPQQPPQQPPQQDSFEVHFDGDPAETIKALGQGMNISEFHNGNPTITTFVRAFRSRRKIVSFTVKDMAF